MDLTQAEKYEVLAAREKLRNSNSSLVEAADYFLKHNAAHKTVPTVDEAIEIWKSEKAKLGLSQKYQESAVRNYFRPFAKKFGKRKLNQIAPQEIQSFIFTHKTWSALTKASHLNYLKTFFSFFIKRGSISLNPVAKIAKPKITEGEPCLLSVSDTTLLLNFAFSHGYKDECAAMALVLFCGIRVDEVDRLTWEAIDFESGIVTIQGKASKRGRKRSNPIPPNAIEWLKRCRPTAHSSRIGPSDYTQRMKRLRDKLQEINKDFVYPQNGMRHSFSAYHLAKHENAPTTAYLLGHPNPNLLYSTYKELTSKRQAELYWEIVPEEVALTRASVKQKKEAEAQVVLAAIKKQVRVSEV
jgi:site-specific recombinase XerC